MMRPPFAVNYAGSITFDRKKVTEHSLSSTRYGPSFAADCYYDSECLRNATAAADSGGASLLGGANSRSWRYQKCGELGYLQRAPTAGGAAAESLRASSLTLDALLGQ